MCSRNSQSPSLAGRLAPPSPAHILTAGWRTPARHSVARHLLAWLLVGLALPCAAAGTEPAKTEPAETELAAATADRATTPALAQPAAGSLAQLNADEARRLATRPAPAGPTLEDINLPPSAERRRLGKLRESLQPAQAPNASVRIKPLEGFLDYNEEDQMIYSPGRTRIRKDNYYLEADKLIYDIRLQEVQAEGNVLLKISEQSEIRAASIRYNFRDNEGSAYNVSGSYPPIYFRQAKGADPTQAQFEKVSRDESIFRNTQVTTCDFKTPHYFVRGREIVLFQNDRVFFRGATFYVWGVPMAYLPVYSRSLTSGSPWSVQLGYSSDTGARYRLSYAYRHRTLEPKFDNEKEFDVRTDGTATIFQDYLSKHGPGLGFDYDYNFNFGKSRGQSQIYGLTDSDRTVVGPSPTDTNTFSESDRWRVMWRHQTEITPNLNLLLNIDEFSDPDVFYDILDEFGDSTGSRNRVVERRGRGALTWIQDEYVARLMVDVRDRVGLDLFEDPSNPASSNNNFNLVPFPNLTSAADTDAVNGISSERWGRVSAKLPQFDLASRYLPAGHTPLYWLGELHLYNNLDDGLNTVSTADDAYVQGAEFYQQLMRQWRLSDRYTLLGKLGAGVGGAQRDNDSLGISATDVAAFNDPKNKTFNGLDLLNFVDQDTFRLGLSPVNHSLSDINPFYAWSDEQLALNARFSDALTGMLRWRARQTTNDFIGDFYASLGSRTFREDLYNYPIRENWVEGNLSYRLFRPLITLSTSAGANLITEQDLYPNEPAAYWNNGVSWANQRQTLTAAAGIGLTRRQIFEPSDPDSFEQDNLGGSVSLRYAPIHQRWNTMLRAFHNDSLNGNVARFGGSNRTTFTDQQTRDRVQLTYGRELGPKYGTEFMVQWDQQVGGLQAASWLLQRDMHDAIAILRLGLQAKNTNNSPTDQTANQLDVRFGFKLKLANQNIGFNQANMRTINTSSRQPALSF